MLRVGGCATDGRAAQQERRHDDAWNQDVIKTKTADTRATRYSLYVLHSTLPPHQVPFHVFVLTPSQHLGLSRDCCGL